MNFDKFIKKSLKLLGNLFWILIIFLIIKWYFENEKKFFPSSPPIEKIHNINPFE